MIKSVRTAKDLSASQDQARPPYMRLAGAGSMEEPLAVGQRQSTLPATSPGCCRLLRAGPETIPLRENSVWIAPVARSVRPGETAVTARTNLADRMEPLTEDKTLECPWCGGTNLKRIRRGLFDRLISLISPQRRFRCESLGCGWEGTLSARHLPPGNAPTR